MVESKGIGLVLSGGGAKGAYQLGVWEALRKADLEKEITAVSGTSVGALNGCMFAMGDIDNCHRVWDTIQREDILDFGKEEREKLLQGILSDFPFLRLHKAFENGILPTLSSKLSAGFFSREKMRQIIQNHIPDPVLCDSKVSAYATCFSCTEMKSKSFLLNGCKRQLAEDILLASSALPLVFPAQAIGEEICLDGGVLDNIPVMPLYRLGYRTFIVVQGSQKNVVDKSRFPGARFLEIIPQQPLGNFFQGTLNFDQQAIQGHIEMGKRDAMAIFSQATSFEDLFASERIPLRMANESELKAKLKLAMIKPLKIYSGLKNTTQK
jgi:NTE family protein